MRQCFNALVLLSAVGTELNHLLGYLHCSPAGSRETKHKSLRASRLPTLCRMHQVLGTSATHGAAHPLLMWPAPDSWAQWTWPCSHRKDRQQCLFHKPQKTRVWDPLIEGLLQSQKGWKNAALLPGSPFYWCTVTRPTIIAIASRLLPGRWAQTAERSVRESNLRTCTELVRAFHMPAHNNRKKRKSKKVVCGVCLQLNHPSENQETSLLKSTLLAPKNQQPHHRRERTEEKKNKRRNSITPNTWVKAEDLWRDSGCTEIHTSMKDFKCRVAENWAKIATKSAYASGFINFIKLAI